MGPVSWTEGEDMVLNCPVSGHPVTARQWKFDGRQLQSSEKYNVGSNGTLLIRSVDVLLAVSPNQDIFKDNYRGGFEMRMSIFLF